MPTDQASASLLQYGAIGAISVLLMVALAWQVREHRRDTNRYITRLEANDDRHLKAWEGVAATLNANGLEFTALRNDVHRAAGDAKDRHGELLGEVRALEGRPR